VVPGRNSNEKLGKRALAKATKGKKKRQEGRTAEASRSALRVGQRQKGTIVEPSGRGCMEWDGRSGMDGKGQRPG
jgi:hypothetical protein